MPRWVDKVKDKLSSLSIENDESRPESRSRGAQQRPAPSSQRSNDLLAFFRRQKESASASSGKTQEFTYSQLDSERHFRLLHLTFEIKKPCWDLVTKSLDDCPIYNAISYSWGSTTVESRMSFKNGQEFPLSGTLKAIICAMEERVVRLNLYDLWIWIDAICINQADDEEKSRQVQMMRDIYSGAALTLVWLGAIDDEQDRVYSTVSRLTELFNRRPIPETENTVRTAIIQDEPWVLHTDEAICDLLDRRWFSRVWIIQEITCSQKVEIIWGSRLIDFEDLQVIVEQYRRLRSTLKSRGIQGFANVGYIESMRNLIKKGGELSFHTALWQGFNFDSTDPRDKAYALLGLVNERHRKGIHIDYGKDPNDIYTEVAFHLLSDTTVSGGFRSSIDVLSAAGIGHAGRGEKLPSWVPDWTRHRRPLNLSMSTYGQTTPRFMAGISKEFVVNTRLRPDASSIIMRGIVLDVVSQQTGTRPSFPQVKPEKYRKVDSAVYRDILIHLDDCIELVSSVCPYPSMEAPQEVLWRTLVGNSSRELGIAPPEYGEFWQQFYEMVKLGSDDDTRTRIQAHPYMNPFKSVYEWLESGRLFVTQGGFVGMGWAGMQKGDKVALIIGALTPYLLREVPAGLAGEAGQTKYQLVGECYVHGLMNGEGLTMGDVEDILMV